MFEKKFVRANCKPSFAFLVLAFNHEEYILEHLESIKYLVQTHGKQLDVDLIVNDDASRDQTRSLVEYWLDLNSTMFRKVKRLYNTKNLGTCSSLDNMLKHMVADRCKITAGDDVYSYENIFELTMCDPNTAMVSGRALYLYGNKLILNRMAKTLATASQAIYHNSPLLHRFKHLSYINAPNLYYATTYLLNSKVLECLRSFDVIEDWPLQVAIGRNFPESQFKLIDQTLVYYRRTTGSTFMIANKRFAKDKLQMYRDLIELEKSFFGKLRLKNRKFCFTINSKILNKIFNINFYIFIFQLSIKIFKIISINKEIKNEINKHQAHYLLISGFANEVLLNKKKKPNNNY